MSCVVGLFEDGEDVLLAQDQVLLVVELHLGAGVLPEEDLVAGLDVEGDLLALVGHLAVADGDDLTLLGLLLRGVRDRKSTRLNSSHTVISYAVFCLKKKKTHR